MRRTGRGAGPGSRPPGALRRAAGSRLAAAQLRRWSRRSADLWRRGVLVRGVDATAWLPGRTTLVLAPHPDDETFGAGALIARMRAAGTPVTVLAATDGRASTASEVLGPQDLADLRARELRQACAILGVDADHVLQLPFADGTLSDHADELTERLVVLLHRLRPAQVLVTAEQDPHPDHRALHGAALAAVHRAGLECDVFSYPVWSWARAPWFPERPKPERTRLQRWALQQLLGRPRPLVVRGDDHLETKRAALAAHASQTSNLTGEPSWAYLTPEWCGSFLRHGEVLLVTHLSSACATQAATDGAGIRSPGLRRPGS